MERAGDDHSYPDISRAHLLEDPVNPTATPAPYEAPYEHPYAAPEPPGVAFSPHHDAVAPRTQSAPANHDLPP